jgi:CheY-like chemotaxis protein
MTSTKAKRHCSYPTLYKESCFHDPDKDSSNSHQQHYRSQPYSPPHLLQNQESNTAASVKSEIKESLLKKVLVVDDDPDLTLTFKVGLDDYYYYDDDKRNFEVHTYNNPAVALSEFKPHFYDLLLTDIYMPHMNGFELCEKILELDANVRVCFMSAAEINIQALREVYPKVSFGCFIKKPVTIEYLVKRLLAELD